MYQEFYGFTERPFSETADPDFLYLSPKHREGLAHLEYSILDGKGFTVLCGDVGTGKTTLCKAIIERLSSDKILFVHILYSRLTFQEFLLELTDQLGLSIKRREKWDLLKSMKKHLMDLHKQNKKVVVILDEAQDVEPSVLEEIRLFSNIEAEKEKLIQIILVGQPQLMDILKRPDMIQIRQRISGYYYLKPLTLEETKEYISYRLSRVQDKPSVRFTSDAVALIYKATKGVPRMINLLCDFSIMEAFVDEVWTINSEHVKRAVAELNDPQLSLEIDDEQEGGEEEKEALVAPQPGFPMVGEEKKVEVEVQQEPREGKKRSIWDVLCFWRRK